MSTEDTDPARAVPQPFQQYFPHVLILTAGVIHVSFVLFQSVNYMVRNDDVFYYFGGARNFALQGRFSFDGIHLTNGVQPLWAALLSIVAWIAVQLQITDPEPLARSFLLVSVALNLGAGWFLFLLCRKWLRRRDALVVLALWLFTPRLVAVQLAGMENALFAFVLMLVLYTYYFKYQVETASLYSTAFFGLLCGLLFLSRLDSIILIIPLMVLLGYRVLTSSRDNRLATMAVAYGMCALPVVPYLTSNVIVFDHLLPVSGAVKWDLAQNTLNGLGGYLSPDYWEFTAKKVFEAVARLLFISWTGVIFAPGIWKAFQSTFLGSFPLSETLDLGLHIPVIGGILLLVWLGWAEIRRNIVRRLRRDLVPRFRKLFDLNLFLLFAVLLFLVHLVLYPAGLKYAGVQWLFVPVYIYLVMILSVPLGVIVDQFVPNLLRRRNVFAAAMMGFLVLNFLTWLYIEAFDPSKHRDIQAAKVEAAMWMAENLDTETLIASDNAGIVGYFSPQRVINTDGLANDFEFLEYKRSGELQAYVRKEGIEYVADYSSSRPDTKLIGISIERIVLEIPVPQKGVTYYVARVER